MQVRDEICLFYLRNRASCLKGSGCVFSHDLKRVGCQYFHEGRCTSGESCIFSHTVPYRELSFPKKETPAPRLGSGIDSRMPLEVEKARALDVLFERREEVAE